MDETEIKALLAAGLIDEAEAQALLAEIATPTDLPKEIDQPLQNFVGRYLIDPISGRAGILSFRTARTGDVYYFKDPSTGKAIGGTIQHGTNLLDPANRAFIAISGNYNNVRISTASQADLARFGFSQDGGGGGGGGGGSALASQAQAQAARDQAQNEFTAKQNELDRAQEERWNRLKLLSDRVAQFQSDQSRARETLAGLQGDPFRFAAALSGQATIGTTPTEAFRNQLTQYSSLQAPQIAPDAPLAAIDQAIQGLGQQQGPQAPPVFGMAGGGTINGGMQFGTQKRAVMLGEGTGTGAEIGIIDPQMGGGITEVIPLSGGAQTGMTFDPRSLQTIAPYLYGSGGIPRQTQVPGYGSYSSGASAQNLGYNPALIRDVSTGKIFHRSGNNLSWITSPEDFNRFGFRQSDIFNVAPGELNMFGNEGSPLTSYDPTAQSTASAFGPASSFFTEPTTGAVLPQPYKIARKLEELKLTQPDIYNLILSAYSSAGFGLDTLESQRQNALPRGGQRTLIGLR